MDCVDSKIANMDASGARGAPVAVAAERDGIAGSVIEGEVTATTADGEMEAWPCADVAALVAERSTADPLRRGEGEGVVGLMTLHNVVHTSNIDAKKR